MENGITPIDIYESIGAAVLAFLALLAVLGIAWQHGIKPVWRVFMSQDVEVAGPNLGQKKGIFPRLEQRLTEAEQARQDDNSEARQQWSQIQSSLATVQTEQHEIRRELSDLNRKVGTHGERLATLEGMEREREFWRRHGPLPSEES